MIIKNVYSEEKMGININGEGGFIIEK